MHYSNMRCRHAALGDIVKTGQQVNAMHYMVKRIDTLQEQVYLVPLDNSFPGQWYSGNALFLVV